MSKPLLSVSGLGISTVQDPRTLVNSVSFEIMPGEAVGVLEKLLLRFQFLVYCLVELRSLVVQ